jgi:aconitate hydratase
MLYALARKHGLHFSRPGNGISHYIHMERFGRPGETLIGADSHTTQAGCLGMVAIGAGGLDVAVVLGGYPYEIACPEIVEVFLDGSLERPWVQAKDIILELLRRLSASGGKNKVFEFTGPGTADLSIPERATIANMIAELGGTSGVFPPDEAARRWLQRQDRAEDFDRVGPEDGAAYDDRIEIALDQLGPLVAKPHNPDNVVAVEEVAGTPIGQVCIGSSVNSGYNDLALCGAVLADRGGQIVHPEIGATATPGSRQILAAIAESGVYRQLSNGGVRMLEPVCGPCVGMGQAPPSDTNSLRTFNRNFRGRSGTPEVRCTVLAGRRRGVAADRQDRGPTRVRPATRPAANARAGPLRRGRPHHRAGRSARGRAHRDPTGRTSSARPSTGRSATSSRRGSPPSSRTTSRPAILLPMALRSWRTGPTSRLSPSSRSGTAILSFDSG